jgi:diguanylate cyclase (GGDEF)-like protein
MLSKTTLKFLTIPGGVLLLSVAVLVHSGWLTLPLPAISFLDYSALVGGILLSWRFHSSRVFLALVVLFLAQQGIAMAVGAHAVPGSPGWIVLSAATVLVPLNFILIAIMPESGLTVSGVAPVGLFLFLQTIVIAVLSQRPGTQHAVSRVHHAAAPISLPGYAVAAFVIAGAILLVRSLITRKPVDGALLWSLAAFFLSVQFLAVARTSTSYSATAACILAASIIETSYLLAYHDELTSLPSRRAFNDALLRLQAPYSIAAVDIDHFKRFNDTYGHDTGDQVLRLVAAKLARVTGGGEAYRCGGEEFTILFPGKTAAEVKDHLEQMRAAVESAEFHQRGTERRQTPRGPDRRGRETASPRTRGRGRKGQAIRKLAEQRSPAPLSVTVSIGLASASTEKLTPELVMQAADKALYRAKANGRNRLETASSPRRQSERKQAAGIA